MIVLKYVYNASLSLINPQNVVDVITIIFEKYYDN